MHGPSNDSVATVDPRENTFGKAFVVVAGPACGSVITVGTVPALPAMAAYFAAHDPSAWDWAFFAQLMQTLPALVMILSAPLVGIASERWGRRNCLLAASLLYVVAGTAGLFVADATTLIAVRILVGISGAGILTPCLALASDFPEHGARERIIGFSIAASSLSALLIFNVGGGMVDAAGWRAPFILHLVGLVIFVAAWSALPTHRGMHVKQERDVLAALGACWPVYAMMVLLTIGMFMPNLQVPFLLEEAGVTSAATIGMVVSVSSIPAAAAAASFGFISRILNRRFLVVLTAACFGAGCAVIALSGTTIGLVALGCGILGVGSGLVEPVCATLIFSRAPVSMRPRAVGLLLSALFLGQFINPLAVTPLRYAFGLQGAFLAVGGIFLAFAMLIAAQRGAAAFILGRSDASLVSPGGE